MQTMLEKLIDLRREFRKLLLEKAYDSNRGLKLLVISSLASRTNPNCKLSYSKLRKLNADDELILVWDAYIDTGNIILNFLERK